MFADGIGKPDMGHVYRQKYTKPLPNDVELFTKRNERFASWRDGNGKKKTAKVTTGKNGDRLLIESKTYTAKYRDGGGQMQTVSTGCRTMDAARGYTSP